jgi:hypothetical protein
LRYLLGQEIVIQASQAEKNRIAATAKFKKEQFLKQMNPQEEKAKEAEKPLLVYIAGLLDAAIEVNEKDLKNVLFLPALFSIRRH